MFLSGRFHNHIFEVSIGIGTAVLIFVTYRVFREPKRKISRIIDTMEFLKKNTVHIRSRNYVEEVVSQLIKGGAAKLQVIADFDHTITRVHMNGAKCISSYCVLERSSQVSKDYVRQVTALNEHYFPIEIDPNLTREQKTPFMVEWYTKATDLLPISGIKKQYLPDMLDQSPVYLRDGVPDVFGSLFKQNVPLLVFSAGVGDVVKAVLQKYNVLYPNVNIVANFLHFNEEGNVLGFKGNVIHTFNKDQTSIDNQDYFNQHSSRNNIILLGDTLGDLDMAAGIVNVNSILKIGFLNHHIEGSMDKYLDSYDIVLADDQSMDVVVGLLQSIL